MQDKVKEMVGWRESWGGWIHGDGALYLSNRSITPDRPNSRQQRIEPRHPSYFVEPTCGKDNDSHCLYLLESPAKSGSDWPNGNFGGSRLY